MVLIKNMKLIWMIGVLVFIVSCAAQNHRPVLMDESIIMELMLNIPESIEVGQEGIPILIELTNSSQADYKVSSVKYWSNVTIQIKKGDELVHGIKVKPDFSKRNEYIFLEAGKTIREEFDFHLDAIYRSLTKGLYTIEATYNGNILDENKRAVKPSNEIKTASQFTIQ